MADVAVRRDLPDSVHQMRVAARRLRSTLTTFAPLMDAAACAELKDELRWLASELGAIRDTEVLMARLDVHASSLADANDAQRCRDVIDPLLRTRLAAARSSALAALRSDRHQQLVDDLMDVAVNPPVTDAAYVPCVDVLPALVARTWQRLRRSVSRLEVAGPSAEWHEARIKAKRARYAAEAVEGILGRPTRRLAESLAEVTELLGDHQDAHVSQTLLREIAARPDTDGVTGMSLGLLHTVESAVERADRSRFGAIWSRARKRAKAAGVA
jgi:CHAD domain-containing protein